MMEKSILEFEISMMECERDLLLLPYVMLYESSDEGVKNRIKVMIDKIKDLIRKAADSIKKFVENTVLKKKVDEAEQRVKDEPELRNKKMTMKPYEKLMDLNRNTMKKLQSLNGKNHQESLDELMSQYEKSRKAILSTFITISFAAVIAFIVHARKVDREYDEWCKEIDRRHQDAVNAAKVLSDKDLPLKMKNKYPKLEKEIQQMVDDGVFERMRIQALSHIAKNQMKDHKEMLSDSAKVLNQEMSGNNS